MNNKLPLSNVVDELHRNAIMNTSHQVKMADGSLSDIRDKLIEESSKALNESESSDQSSIGRQYFDHVQQGIYNTVGSYARGAQANQVSLFGYAKSTIISSRMYIEETLATEAIIPNLTRNLLNLYVGMIITALNLDKYVRDGRKVNEIMSLVATEDFTPLLKDINIEQVVSDYFIPEGAKRYLSNAVLSDYFVMRKKQNKNNRSKSSNNNNNNNNNSKSNTDNTTPEQDATPEQNTIPEQNVAPEPIRIEEQGDSIFKEESTSINTDFSYKPLNLVNKDMQLPCSALIQLDIETSITSTSSGNDAYGRVTVDKNKQEKKGSNRIVSSKTDTKKLSILVQLRPAFIPSTVMRAFVDMNFTLPISKRWLQATAGEISFFKDFLLGCDIDKRYRKALRDDKTGILKEMFETQASALNRHFQKIASQSAFIRNLTHINQSNSVNIANTILIFDKQSFDRACNTAGINFNNYNVRKRFFEKTYAMIICLVDTNYNYISMFYNGIAQASTFTFNQINTNAKTESTDLISIMKSYAANMAPKF